jgi:hypothetical protein
VSPLENAASVEHAATASMAAARSLARAANVDVATAARHLANGTAATLIECRGGAADHAIERRNLARIEYLYRLRALEILRYGDDRGSRHSAVGRPGPNGQVAMVGGPGWPPIRSRQCCLERCVCQVVPIDRRSKPLCVKGIFGVRVRARVCGPGDRAVGWA